MIKLGIKEFSRSLVSNIFIALQLSVTFIIAIACVSSLLSRTMYYTPVKDFIKDKGFFITGIIDSAELSEVLKDIDEIEKIYSGYSVRMTYAPLNDQSRLKNVEALDDDYLKAFTPKMLSGKWLDEYNSDSDEIYGVITENVGGNSVGDVIDATYMNVISEKLDYVDIEDYLENFKFEEIPVKIKIVGIIEDSSKILGFSNDSITNDNDFRSLYSECNKNDSESSHLIVSAEQMNKQGYKMTQSESRICIVNDNLTENEYTKLYRNIRQYGIITSLDDFRNNTTTYISSELIKLLPIFISLFILVIVSSVSISALNIKERIKEYGIFYICGSGWKSCILINFINNILTAITSFIITLIILNIMKISGFLGNTVITLGKWQLLVCGGIVVVNLLISLIMPIGIMRKNTPRGILMSNE